MDFFLQTTNPPPEVRGGRGKEGESSKKNIDMKIHGIEWRNSEEKKFMVENDPKNVPPLKKIQQKKEVKQLKKNAVKYFVIDQFHQINPKTAKRGITKEWESFGQFGQFEESIWE